MKRITLIAATLGFLVLTSVGAGLVVAKPEANVPQAGKSSIFQFDVTYGGTVVGTLVIDGKHQTFVFNGKGLTPDISYNLLFVYTIGPAQPDIMGSAQTTENGTMHIKDSYHISIIPLPDKYAFTLLPARAAGDCDLNCTIGTDNIPHCQYEC